MVWILDISVFVIVVVLVAVVLFDVRNFDAVVVVVFVRFSFSSFCFH